jgi:hypothetical protein
MRIISYPTTNLIPDYGRDHSCFCNAREYVLGDCEGDGDMRYCEGLLYCPAPRLAFHHAWAVDVRTKENYEVSPMGPLGASEGMLYFGCIVGRSRLRSRYRATRASFFTFRELEPIQERIRGLHPVDEFCRAMRDSDACPCGSGKKWKKCCGGRP